MTDGGRPKWQARMADLVWYQAIIFRTAKYVGDEGRMSDLCICAYLNVELGKLGLDICQTWW